jgi:hypothetical protein
MNPEPEPSVERRRRIQNRVLRSLPPVEYARISRLLEEATIEPGGTLEGPGGAATHVYFPMDGVYGLTSLNPQGRPVAVVAMGCEGVSAVRRLFDTREALTMALQIGPARVARLPAWLFDEEMDRHGSLWQAVRQYYRGFISDLVQGVACARLHSVRQRCCLWLLTLADRRETDTVAITHDALSALVGVHRPAITSIVTGLRTAGIVGHARGTFEVLDRSRLEGTACGCYRACRARLEQLLPLRS